MPGCIPASTFFETAGQGGSFAAPQQELRNGGGRVALDGDAELWTGATGSQDKGEWQDGFHSCLVTSARSARKRYFCASGLSASAGARERSSLRFLRAAALSAAIFCAHSVRSP